MCVCAGATGAAVVPVAQKARASFVHHAAAQHRAAPSASAPLPITCAPTIASAVPAVLSAGNADLTPLLAAPVGIALAGFGESVGGGFVSPGSGGGGGGIGGGGIGGGGGGGGLPGSGPNVPPTVPAPGGGTGSVPEPGTWTMMISGFGMVGGVVRGHRKQEV